MIKLFALPSRVVGFKHKVKFAVCAMLLCIMYDAAAEWALYHDGSHSDCTVQQQHLINNVWHQQVTKFQQRIALSSGPVYRIS